MKHIRTCILLPLAALYRIAYKLHHRLFLQPGEPLSHAKLIVVGSFLSGGAGKTPFCIALAERLHHGNATSAQLSTLLAESSSIPNPGNLTTPSNRRIPKIAVLCHSKAKDEAALLQWRLPFAKVIATGNRYETALAIDSEYDYIICDDGFEDSRLTGAYTVRLDWGKAPTRLQDLLPVGKCRSLLQDHPAANEIYRCTADDETSETGRTRTTIQTRDRTRRNASEIRGTSNIRKLAFSIESISNCEGARLTSRNIVVRNDIPNCGTEPAIQDIVALCGIGNPARFFNDLAHYGIACTRQIALRDHFPDLEQTLLKILENGTVYAVITEKDWIKLGESARNTPRIFIVRQQISTFL